MPHYLPFFPPFFTPPTVGAFGSRDLGFSLAVSFVGGAMITYVNVEILKSDGYLR